MCGGATVGHLRLPDNSVNFYSLEPGGVNLEARQSSLKNANTSFEWLMQSGELGAFVYSFILTWQSKEVRCMTLRVEGNFCGRPELGVREFVCDCREGLIVILGYSRGKTLSHYFTSLHSVSTSLNNQTWHINTPCAKIWRVITGKYSVACIHFEKKECVFLTVG